MKLKQVIVKRMYLYPTILAVFMLMTSGINAFAQDKSDKIKITGTVYDETKQPLAGASVREERTSNGTITDQDGNFTIYVKKGSTIRISFLGLESKVMTANIAGKFDIMLKDNTKELGQVVVTGYGKTTKDRVTGSVGIVTAKDLKGSPTANIDQLLQGKLAGVSVQAVSGRPGESSTIRIRGTRSLTKESADPLWVIDGVPLQRNIPKINNSRLSTGDFNDIFTSGIAGIDPNEIESVSVLKDASAAVYGVRAANGVVLVTTRRGTKGKPEITLNASYGIQNITKFPKSVDAYGYMELYNEAMANRGETVPTYDPSLVTSGSPYANVNWFDQVVRSTVPQWQINMNISGGNDRVQYFNSIGYYSEEGLWKANSLNYERYNLRSNITAKITDQLTAEFLFQSSGIHVFGINLNRIDNIKSGFDQSG